MDHEHIERRQIIDRYLMGRLEGDEAERFEEHVLHCQECVEQLELATRLQRGLKRAAAADGARVATARLGLIAWLGRLSRGRQLAAVLGALLLAILLPTAVGLRESGRLQHELEAAREALGAERDVRDELEAELGFWRRPQADVVLLSLQPERSGTISEPTHRLRLRAEPRLIVLALELDRVEPGSYSVALSSEGGDEVWRGDRLEADHLDSLVLGLPSTLLVAGDYRLEVERRLASGELVPAGSFALRVLPAAGQQ